MDAASKVIHEWAEKSMRRSMRAYFLYAQQTGLSVTQLNTLFLIHCKKKISINDLAKYWETSNANASQVAERLVSQSLVDRSEDPADRRIRLLSLTPMGLDLVRTANFYRHAWIDDLVASLNAEDKEKVVSLFALLNKRFTEFFDTDQEGS